MTPTPMQAAAPQQALALGLAGMVTAAVLWGLLGLAQADQSALMAQQMQTQPQAAAAPLPGPQA